MLRKECPLLEGADYAAVNPAKLSTVEINRTTTHLKQSMCFRVCCFRIRTFSTCKLLYTVAESVFSRGNHNTVTGFDMFLI